MLRHKSCDTTAHMFIDIYADDVQVFEPADTVSVDCILSNQTSEDIHHLFYLDQGFASLFLTDQDYSLEPGCFFYIAPSSVFQIKKIGTAPILLFDIQFSGSSSFSIMKWVGFNLECPIIRNVRSSFISSFYHQLLQNNLAVPGRELGLTGFLYLILDCLLDHQKSTDQVISSHKANEYIKAAICFIETHFDTCNLSVMDVSNHVGLNSNYLCTIFKKETHVTPKDYLTQVRMNEACALLKTTVLPIGSIASSVGYTDQLLFSKMFKKHMNLSPTNYRKERIHLL